MSKRSHDSALFAAGRALNASIDSDVRSGFWSELNPSPETRRLLRRFEHLSVLARFDVEWIAGVGWCGPDHVAATAFDATQKGTTHVQT